MYGFSIILRVFSHVMEASCENLGVRKSCGSTYLLCFQLETTKLAREQLMTHSICSIFSPGDFRIDNTGTVYVNRGLDRERIATYFLVVGAYNYETKAFNETSRPRERNIDGMISH